MLKEIIGMAIAFLLTGCSTYTQFSHPDDVSSRPSIRDNSKRNNIHYDIDVCVEYSNYSRNYYNRHLIWDRWRNCWVHDPYRYNGYYNGDYNYWYWHHYNEHHNNHHDDDYNPPPSNQKKERRENNYVRPPTSSSNNTDDTSSNNDSNISSNSNKNSNNNSNTKTKRTKTRKRK